MEADALLSAALTAIPRANVAALIDLPSGMFLAVQPERDNTAALDLFAASIKEIYEGDLSQGLRAAGLNGPAGASDTHDERINLFVISGDGALHVMVRMQAQPNLVLAVCCPAAANIGMSLVKVRHLAMTYEIEGV
jgi:hypothetical protein